jgi:nicotinamide-nucleotide amidase
MQDLIPQAARIAAILKGRRETVAVAESSTGGLISAALLSIAGASAYFIGGSVVYTLKARRALLQVPDQAFAGFKSLDEKYALILAREARSRLAATWSIAEIGASGPTGNRYGDPAGTSCIAVVGTNESSLTLHTGSQDRIANMRSFAAAALDLLLRSLGKAAPVEP